MRTHKLLLPMLIALALGLFPNAGAESAHDGYIYLYDDGADGAPSATTDWRFYVATPSYVGLDDSDGNWTFTAYGQMVNNTGSATTGTWTLTLYIEAGGVNRSVSKAITVSKTAIVYGNLSFADTVYSLYEKNSTAEIYITLTNATGVVKDSWVGTIRIDSNSIVGVAYVLVGAVISIAVVVMIIGWFGSVTQDMQKALSPTSRSGNRKRRR